MKKKHTIYTVLALTLGGLILTPWFVMKQMQEFSTMIPANIPHKPAEPRINLPEYSLNNVKTAPTQKEHRINNIAWIVQVGSFANINEAELLIKLLRNKGFPAYVQKNKSNEVEIYIVQVGPVLQNNQVLQLRNEIKKSLNLNGTIASFDPTTIYL